MWCSNCFATRRQMTSARMPRQNQQSKRSFDRHTYGYFAGTHQIENEKTMLSRRGQRCQAFDVQEPVHPVTEQEALNNGDHSYCVFKTGTWVERLRMYCDQAEDGYNDQRSAYQVTRSATRLADECKQTESVPGKANQVLCVRKEKVVLENGDDDSRHTVCDRMHPTIDPSQDYADCIDCKQNLARQTNLFCTYQCNIHSVGRMSRRPAVFFGMTAYERESLDRR